MELSTTIAIIAVTALVSWLGFGNEKLVQRLILWPPAVTRGHQYDRVNHSAHLAGAAYGVLFTVMMEPRVAGHFLQSLLDP